MTVLVELPDDLAERLSAVAANRGMTLEQLAVEVIQGWFPRSPSVSFIGIGASGDRSAAGRGHREALRQAFRDRPARDV